MLLLFSLPAQAQNTEKDYAVQKIAETLKRLGENEIAERFLRDYANKDSSHSLVRIEDLGGQGVNAETGPDLWGRVVGGPNHLTLDAHVLEEVPPLKKLLNKNPYGDFSTLVRWATTVYHEYVHMDQNSPKNTPKFEDEAWQKTDQALVRWYRKLYDEFERLKSQPNSQKKGKELTEIKNLLSHIHSEMGTQEEGIARNIKNGTLTQGQTWKSKKAMPLVKTLISNIAQEIKKNKGQNSSAGVGSERWVLTKKYVKSHYTWKGYSFKTDYANATASFRYKPTAYEAYYKKQKMFAKFSFSWRGIPPLMEPKKSYPITLKVADAGSIPEKNVYGEIEYPQGTIDLVFESCPFAQKKSCFGFSSPQFKGKGSAHTMLPNSSHAQSTYTLTTPTLEEVLVDLPKYHTKSELKEETQIRVLLDIGVNDSNAVYFVYTWDPTGTLKPIPVADPSPWKPALPTNTALPSPTLQPASKDKKQSGKQSKVKEIFSTNNIYSVSNFPTAPTTFTLNQPHFFAEITTYHWNSGKGTAKPGTIALVDDQGNFYGPWTAIGKAGQGNVPNAYWKVTPKRSFPAGTYTVVDSDPGSWSQNSHSGGRGIVIIQGYPANSPLPSPTLQPASKDKKQSGKQSKVKEIFSTNNIYSVSNFPTAPTTFTLNQPHFFAEITTYHWNSGKGTAKPGTIALVDDQGNFYGPWTAIGKAGQGNVPNAYWKVTPKRSFPVGTYTVVDSDPGSWSQNSHSGGRGIVIIQGYPLP